MITTAQDLLQFLTSNFPEFENYWHSDDNYFVDDDGSYSASGVSAQFSHYFYESDNAAKLNERSLVILFKFIEYESIRKNSELSDALFTCFVENIAQTNSGEFSKQFMQENTLEYFLKWHEV